MKISAFNSRHLKILLPAIGAILLLAGCGPENALLWAPDGEHACVIGSDKTPSLIVDGSGNIVGPILDENGTSSSATVLAWMPDSRRVIVTRQVQPKSWMNTPQFSDRNA